MNSQRRVCVGVAVAAALAVGGCGATSSSTTSAPKPVKLTEQQIIKQSTPSVVRIQGATGGGTGFVIDAKQGLVLTNAHVVAGNSALKAQVGNDPTTGTPVQLVAASPCDDLAVVRLVNPVTGLKALPLGSSPSVRPGDTVTVLGFPGSQQSAGSGPNRYIGQASQVVSNTGTVSQLGVEVNGDSSASDYDPALPTYPNTIVHQAPINHGNSGGPLLNSKGQVIGVNSLGGADTQGQYYSISIDYAKRLLPDLEAGKSHGLVGWDLYPMSAYDPQLTGMLHSIYADDSAFSSYAGTLTKATAHFLQEKPPTVGMYDYDDQPGSPADKVNTAGFLIYAINGSPVESMQDICDQVNSASPGQRVHLSTFNINAGSRVKDLSSVESLYNRSYKWGANLKIPVS